MAYHQQANHFQAEVCSYDSLDSVKDTMMKVHWQTSSSQSLVKSNSASPAGSPITVNELANGNAFSLKSINHTPLNNNTVMSSPTAMKSSPPLLPVPHYSPDGSTIPVPKSRFGPSQGPINYTPLNNMLKSSPNTMKLSPPLLPAPHYSPNGSPISMPKSRFGPRLGPISHTPYLNNNIMLKSSPTAMKLSPPLLPVPHFSPDGSPIPMPKSRFRPSLGPINHTPLNNMLMSSPTAMKLSPPLLTAPHYSPDGSPISMPEWTRMEQDKMFRIGPSVGPVYAENSFCQKLFEFTSEHKLGMPDFVNFHRYNYRRNIMEYMSRVKVQEWTYSSMPVKHTNLSVVQECAAKKALDELIEKFAEKEGSATLQTTTDKLLIIHRVADIVGGHSNGLKAEFVEASFRKLFNEKLPQNWMDIIKSCAPQSVENLINGFYIYPLQQTVERNIPNVSELPPLELPKANVWNIFLTLCISSSLVYFRLVGPEHDGKYSALAEQMEIMYGYKKSDRKPAPTIVQGHYYAAFTGNQWFRVKILPNDLSDKRYRVFLVDVGDIEDISEDCLFTLHKDFTSLPAQAIKCSLTGLEELHDNADVTRELKFISQRKRACVAEVNSRQPDLKLTLYDTTTDEDINLNEEIRGRLLNKKLSMPPKMPTLIQNGHDSNVKNPPSCTTEAVSLSVPPFPLPYVGGWLRICVSMVLNRGRFVIQPLDFKDELKKMTEEMGKYYSFYKPVANVTEILKGRVFAVMYENKEWRRGMVLDVLQDIGEVSIMCMDHGNIFTIDFRMVYCLLPHFQKIPALAMEAEIAGIAPRGLYWSMKDCLYLNELLVNKEFLARVVKKTDGVVSLMLVYADLTSATHISVGDQLVREGRAIMIE